MSIEAESLSGHNAPKKQVPLPSSTFTREQQQIRQLQRGQKEAQLDRLAEATRSSKEGRQHLLQDRRELFQFIKGNDHLFPSVRRGGWLIMCILPHV
ncbi:hypothetical protein [Spirosoma litoris]